MLPCRYVYYKFLPSQRETSGILLIKNRLTIQSTVKYLKINQKPDSNETMTILKHLNRKKI